MIVLFMRLHSFITFKYVQGHFVLEEDFLNLSNIKNVLRRLKYRFLGFGLESSIQ